MSIDASASLRRAEPVSLTPRPGQAVLARPPAPLSTLIARKPEIAAVSALLTDPFNRLVTLTGPGGVGKTRLALAVAVDLDEREIFADGIAFVALASLSDPILVASAIAQAIGVRGL